MNNQELKQVEEQIDKVIKDGYFESIINEKRLNEGIIILNPDKSLWKDENVKFKMGEVG